MKNHSIHLTQAEWSVMECLWEHSPQTGREVIQQMEGQCGWNRSTTLTLLSRMEGKGAIVSDSSMSKKTFRPLICREDAALQETEDFLGRVYQGSLSMMVSALTRKQTLSQKEIDELYGILKGLEGESSD